METKVLSRDSILTSFQKTLLDLILRRLTGFLLGGGGHYPPPPPLVFGAQKSLLGIGLKLHIIVYFLTFHLSMCAFQGTKLERWHRLELMKSFDVQCRWRDIGGRLPNLPEHLNGRKNGNAFSDTDLQKIHNECKLKSTKCQRDAERLYTLLEKWAKMSRNHTVEVLSDVLRELRLGEAADELPFFKKTFYYGTVKVAEFLNLF